MKDLQKRFPNVDLKKYLYVIPENWKSLPFETLVDFIEDSLYFCSDCGEYTVPEQTRVHNKCEDIVCTECMIWDELMERWTHYRCGEWEWL